MSAFSRGCLLRHQCAYSSPRTIHIFFQPINSPRFFTTTSLLQAKKQSRSPSPKTQTSPRSKPSTAPATKSPLPSKPSFTLTKTSLPSTTAYGTYASTFAQKSHSTLLYEAPSHTAFIASNWGTALFCYSWAVFNYWGNYLYAPTGLSEWVPPAYLSVSVLMAGGGTYLALNSANIIRSITAIPPKASTGGDGALDPRVVKNGTGGEEELQIEIILRKMFPIPFFPARKLYVKPEDIILPQQLAPPLPTTLTRGELREIQLEKERRKQELEYDRSHLLTSPFRHMNRAFFNAFRGIRRTWSREGFVKAEVKGKVYKLDIHGGWALDGGKALDRLVKVRPRL
ncbi:uncharacterized protein PAC_16098 [Phialocephala subalpina]|uniref:Uncharacterized protein n=1 Tax=Phialocephala subalpina TaxID=576137 RepID=A0A1L7XMM3_9HELO|nr:uncharacterized protein PAC_16098 [Phialocephala subalpina]